MGAYNSSMRLRAAFTIFIVEVALFIAWIALSIAASICAREGLLDIVLSGLHTALFIFISQLVSDAVTKGREGASKELHIFEFIARLVTILSILVMDIFILLKHIFSSSFDELLPNRLLFHYLNILLSSLYTFSSTLLLIWILFTIPLISKKSRKLSDSLYDEPQNDKQDQKRQQNFQKSLSYSMHTNRFIYYDVRYERESPYYGDKDV